MIDAHVHLFPADDLSESTRTIVGVANAQTDLNAGFTTVLDMKVGRLKWVASAPFWPTVPIVCTSCLPSWEN